MSPITTLLLCALTTLTAACRSSETSTTVTDDPFGELDGALVLIDCSSGRETTYRPDAVDARAAPCSTFKIVNALIAIEEGLVTSADQAFYRWDGVERSVAAWNRDLSFEQAFAVSCVPAFQELARRIGAERMQHGIDALGYGNGDISAGIDAFWLPAGGRQTILISPREQARLMQRIVAADVPFSDDTLSLLKQVMFLEDTPAGRLYGKTGSGLDPDGTPALGWFVGYVESGGRAHAFACVAQGANVMSRDARTIAARVLEDRGLLSPSSER